MQLVLFAANQLVELVFFFLELLLLLFLLFFESRQLMSSLCHLFNGDAGLGHHVTKGSFNGVENDGILHTAMRLIATHDGGRVRTQRQQGHGTDHIFYFFTACR